MSDRPEIDRDAELVRRIARSYRPPEPAPSARAAFRAGIDARIRRRALQRWTAGAATAAAALAFVLLRGSPAPIAPTADIPDDAALPRGQREAFVLVHLEGLTLVEAASATGRAVGTMKSHLHRALASLRERLADLAPEETR